MKTLTQYYYYYSKLQEKERILKANIYFSFYYVLCLISKQPKVTLYSNMTRNIACTCKLYITQRTIQLNV
jgi:hypothetical protein